MHPVQALLEQCGDVLSTYDARRLSHWRWCFAILLSCCVHSLHCFSLPHKWYRWVQYQSDLNWITADGLTDQLARLPSSRR